MTTRNGRSVWQVCLVFCLMLFAAPAAVHGDGSISFNGGSTGTSKLQNENGNVMNSQSQVTICA